MIDLNHLWENLRKRVVLRGDVLSLLLTKDKVYLAFCPFPGIEMTKNYYKTANYEINLHSNFSIISWLIQNENNLLHTLKPAWFFFSSKDNNEINQTFKDYDSNIVFLVISFFKFSNFEKFHDSTFLFVSSWQEDWIFSCKT